MYDCKLIKYHVIKAETRALTPVFRGISIMIQNADSHEFINRIFQHISESINGYPQNNSICANLDIFMTVTIDPVFQSNLNFNVITVIEIRAAAPGRRRRK